MSEFYYTVDWSDFKSMLRTVIVEKKPADFLKINRASFKDHSTRGDSFSGVSLGQLARWLSDGYQTETIRGLTEFVPPIREKRKFVFGEEGDEFHFDIAASGGEQHFSYFTKRDSIPGVAIEAGIMFSAGIAASTVAAYNTWICKIAYSLESAGIDTQITLDFPSWNLARETGGMRTSAGTGNLYHNIVRVKKENEASDFLSWSAMLSPAALRNFGFALGDLHCESRGEVITGSFGRGVPERRTWKVKYNPERRAIEIQNAYSAYGDFPAEDMTRQFREALKTMQGKLTN